MNGKREGLRRVASMESVEVGKREVDAGEVGEDRRGGVETGRYLLRQCPAASVGLGREAADVEHFPTGFIVAVEGIDGAGVTSVSKFLANTLPRVIRGAKAVYLKEPTDSPIGHLLREILRRYIQGIRMPEVLTHLFIADRIHHLYEYEVIPRHPGALSLLDKGFILVFDRYKYSNAVYQAAGYGASVRGAYSITDILALNSLAPPAHILVYLDVDPREALRRIAASRQFVEEPETLPMFERIKAGYETLINYLSENPEWPPKNLEDMPAWFRMLLMVVNVDPQCIYPPIGIRSPYIIRVDANKPLDKVTSKVLEQVIKAAEKLRLVQVA